MSKMILFTEWFLHHLRCENLIDGEQFAAMTAKLGEAGNLPYESLAGVVKSKRTDTKKAGNPPSQEQGFAGVPAPCPAKRGRKVGATYGFPLQPPSLPPVAEAGKEFAGVPAMPAYANEVGKPSVPCPAKRGRKKNTAILVTDEKDDLIRNIVAVGATCGAGNLRLAPSALMPASRHPCINATRLYAPTAQDPSLPPVAGDAEVVAEAVKPKRVYKKKIPVVASDAEVVAEAGKGGEPCLVEEALIIVHPGDAGFADIIDESGAGK